VLFNLFTFFLSQAFPTTVLRMVELEAQIGFCFFLFVFRFLFEFLLKLWRFHSIGTRFIIFRLREWSVCSRDVDVVICG